METNELDDLIRELGYSERLPDNQAVKIINRSKAQEKRTRKRPRKSSMDDETDEFNSMKMEAVDKESSC